MTTLDRFASTVSVAGGTRRARTMRLATFSWWSKLRAQVVAADALALAMSLLVTWLLWGGQVMPASAPISGSAVAVLFGVVWMASLAFNDSRHVNLLGAGPREYRLVISSSLRAVAALAIAGYFLDLDVSRTFCVATLLVGTVVLLGGRWILRWRLSRDRERGDKMVPTIVMGGSAEIEPMLRQLRANRGAGYQPIGISSRQPMRDDRVLGGLPWIPMEVLGSMLGHLPRSAVVVAGGVDDAEVHELTTILEGTSTELMLVPRLLDVAGQRMSFRQAAGLNLVHVALPQFQGVKYWIKRGFDVCFAALALLMLLPVFGVISLLIKLGDGGPVIYRQTRVGLRGETFVIHKFRSMHLDADKRLAELRQFSVGAGPLFKMDHDPRITRVGAFLRKHSLDELPQFWTVLRGGMSVVGPRPHLARELDEFPEHALRRLLIKPGITGLWQVGGRSDLSLDDAIRLDLRYVENWTVAEDLSIILKTVRHVVAPHGAY